MFSLKRWKEECYQKDLLWIIVILWKCCTTWWKGQENVVSRTLENTQGKQDVCGKCRMVRKGERGWEISFFSCQAKEHGPTFSFLFYIGVLFKKKKKGLKACLKNTKERNCGLFLGVKMPCLLLYPQGFHQWVLVEWMNVF